MSAIFAIVVAATALVVALAARRIGLRNTSTLGEHDTWLLQLEKKQASADASVLRSAYRQAAPPAPGEPRVFRYCLECRWRSSTSAPHADGSKGLMGICLVNQKPTGGYEYCGAVNANHDCIHWKSRKDGD